MRFSDDKIVLSKAHKVDYWQNSNQILRWNAASLLEIEPNLRKIRGFRYLNILRHRMKQEIEKRQMY
ncbi:MAG: hypothetical protein KJ706_00220 [Candidatus Omnitrophica bacterium]|nr:hypothetical protein [Candidatus Omnitrophota bacterium]